MKYESVYFLLDWKYCNRCTNQIRLKMLKNMKFSCNTAQINLYWYIGLSNFMFFNVWNVFRSFFNITRNCEVWFVVYYCCTFTYRCIHTSHNNKIANPRTLYHEKHACINMTGNITHTHTIDNDTRMSTTSSRNTF